MEGYMYHISILAVGRLKEKYLAEGAAEYLKRLAPYARVEIEEVSDENCPDNLSPAEREKVKGKEGERLLKRLRRDTYLVALDLRGRMYTSEEMAGVLGKLALEGTGDITFVIGGSLGLSKAVLEKADLRLSFSRLTFPHQLMRVILLEQIFRWFKIARGELYHK
jgi:23S rRNA (pseudouridine1915-N3)-methyltransferase